MNPPVPPSPIRSIHPPGIEPSSLPEESPRRHAAPAGVALAMFLSTFGTGVSSIALPHLSAAFEAPYSTVQWVSLAYSLAITILAVSAGRLGDIFGKRPLLTAGAVIYSAAALLCGMAPSLPFLIGMRGLQGAGAALLMTLSLAVVPELTGSARAGRVIGLLAFASAAGMSLGPALGGVLLGAMGWRALFYCISLPGLISVLLLMRGLPAPVRQSSSTDGGLGLGQMALLSLTLFSGIASFQNSHGLPPGLLPGIAAAGLAGLFITLGKSSAPLIDIRMFRDANHGVPLLLSSLITAVMTAPLVAAPFYLTAGLNLSAAQSGLVLAAGPVITALSGLPAGRLTDRYGPALMVPAGLILTTAGSVLLALLPPGTGTLGYLVSVLLLNAGYAVFQSANTTAVMNGAASTTRGVTAGLLSLSRNLGMVTGLAAFGAVFSSGGAGPISAAGAVRGTHLTFTIAATVSGIGLAALLAGKTRRTVAAVLLFLVPVLDASPQNSLTAPYPLTAAGWSPEAGNGFYYSRWAEDWSGGNHPGQEPALKGLPLPGGGNVSLSAEIRLRYEATENALPGNGSGSVNGLYRGVIGADLHWNRHFRLYAETATGQWARARPGTPANMQNDASLQQLFLDFHTALAQSGEPLAGVMAGRQEFTDGPRQLISFSDGPNIHRTWNGIRLYWHQSRIRLGAFLFLATEPAQGWFDDGISGEERLQGVNASVRLGDGTFLDPFWFHTSMPEYRAGPVKGADVRDTWGVRLWGHSSTFKFDLTAAAQSGRFMSRDVEAWGIFAAGSVLLSERGWKPRLTGHIDVASGGGSYGAAGTLRGFNPLYASSSYLSEGRFLSLSNLMLGAAGISVSPSKSLRISGEAGLARRLSMRDAVYAGGMRPYPGTWNVSGRDAGVLLRIAGNLDVSKNLSVAAGYDHFFAGDVLRSAHLPSGSFGFISVTYRY